MVCDVIKNISNFIEVFKTIIYAMVMSIYSANLSFVMMNYIYIKAKSIYCKNTLDLDQSLSGFVFQI